MLYLLGGAARSGKTIIAQRFLKEIGIPYFCVDYFVSALEQGAPELGILGESLTLPKAEELWTLLKPLLVNIIEVEPHYMVSNQVVFTLHGHNDRMDHLAFSKDGLYLVSGRAAGMIRI